MGGTFCPPCGISTDGCVIVIEYVLSQLELSLMYIVYVPAVKLWYTFGKSTYVPPEPFLTWYPDPEPQLPSLTVIVPVPP